MKTNKTKCHCGNEKDVRSKECITCFKFKKYGKLSQLNKNET